MNRNPLSETSPPITVSDWRWLVTLFILDSLMFKADAGTDKLVRL